MRRKLAILLCLALLLSLFLVACKKDEGEPAPDPDQVQDTPEDTPEDEPDAPPEETPEDQAPPEDAAPEVELKPYRIAYLFYDLSVEHFANFKNIFVPLGEELNCEFVWAEANTPDYYMEAIENVLASGVDGFVTANTGNMILQYMEACEAKNVYLATTDNNISTEPGFAEHVADNEYFSGWVYSSNYDRAYACGTAMGEFDIETFVAHGLPPGVAQSLDDNFNGGVDALTESGAEMIGEGRSWNHSDTAMSLCNQFPDMDAYYAATDFAFLYQPIVSTGRAAEIVMNADNCTTAALAAVDAGHLDVVTEGTGLAHMAALLLCYNAVSGHNLNPMDGTGGYVKGPMFVFSTPEEIHEWVDLMITNVPYSVDDIKEHLAIYNEDLTFEDFKAWIENWTLDEVKALH